jgi:two-component system phosphate regulon sensor histidine kinase PhoR
MTPEEMGHIFEEFYRTRRAREIERDGTGLGLSIIKKAVETIGGRITVASQVDKGSTVHVYFPRGEHGGL